MAHGGQVRHLLVLMEMIFAPGDQWAVRTQYPADTDNGKFDLRIGRALAQIGDLAGQIGHRFDLPRSTPLDVA